MSGYGWELEQVVKEVRRAEVVLEVGAWRGNSLRVWRREYDPLLLLAIEPEDTVSDQTLEATGAVLVRGRSQDAEVYARVVEHLAGRTIDLLYIDGDHHYKAVRRDWDLYSPLVSPEGVVVLDDAVITWNDTVEVWRLYEELRDGRRTKLVHDGRGGDAGGTGMALVWP